MANAYAQFRNDITVRLDPSVSSAFAQFENRSTRASGAAERGMRRVRIETDNVERRVRGAASAFGAFEGYGGRIASRLNATANAFSTLGRTFGLALGVAAGGGGLVAATSELQNYQARLKAITKDQAEFNSVLSQLTAISNRGRADIGASIAFYTRLRIATVELGTSQRDLGRIIETVQKSIALSGAGAQEAQAALTQFVQGISSANGLSGDEFKSLGENATKVLRAIADGLKETGAIEGFDGTISSLRELGAQGRLTAATVVPAILSISRNIDAEFSRLPLTLSQSTTLLKNQFSTLVLDFERDTKVLSGISNGIAALARNLDVVAAAAGGVAVAFATVGLFRFVAAFQAAGAIGTFAAGLAASATGATAFGAAASASAARIALMRSALGGVAGFLAGPWGLAIAGAGVGLALLAGRKDDVADSAKRMGISEGDLRAEVDALTGGIRAQNRELETNINLKNERGRRAARELIDERNEAALKARGSLASTLVQAPGSLTDGSLRGGSLQAANREFNDFAKLVAKGLDYREVEAGLDRLEKRFPQVFVAAGKRIDEAATNSVSKAIELQRAVTSLGEAQEALLNSGDATRLGNFLDLSKPAAAASRTKQQIDADVAAVLAGAGELERAQASYKQAVADLDARFPQIGKDTAERQAAYQTEKLALAQVLKAAQDAAAARKDQARSAREATAEQAKLAAEARRAAIAQIADETRLDSILNQLSDSPSRVSRAEKFRIFVQGQNDRRVASGLPGYSDEEFKTISDGINAFIVRPLAEANEVSSQQLLLIDEQLAGRQANAEVLARQLESIRQGVPLEAVLRDNVVERVTQERLRTRALEDQNRLIEVQARAIGDRQAAFTRLFATGNLNDLVPDLLASFRNQFAEQLSFSLFGDAERDARDAMTGAIEVNVGALDNNTAALQRFETFLNSGRPNGGIAANDNIGGLATVAATIGGDAAKPLISVVEEFGIGTDSFVRAARLVENSIAKLTGSDGRAVIGSSSGALGALSDALAGAGGGKFGDQLRNLVRGDGPVAGLLKGVGLGQIGGAISGGRNGVVQNLGALAGTAIGGPLGGFIGGTIGGAFESGSTGKAVGATAGAIGGFILGGPIGAAIGSILGSLVGGLFKKTQFGEATLTSGAGGVNSFIRARGDGRAEQIGQVAGSVGEALSQLAKRLNAEIVPGISIGRIGTYKDSIFFNPTGGGFNDPGRVTYNSAEEAVAAAIRSAVNRGAFEGLRDGTRRLLSAAGDLESQLDKALRFEGVFKDLRKALDPVGAAIDDLNSEFKDLERIFREAGASADEFAKLQQLYDLQRAETLRQADSTLRDFLRDLTTSSSTGLSARDRLQAAEAEFAGFRTSIANGETINQGDYQTAANLLLEINRELYGSQQEYFATLADITNLTRDAISNVENVTSIADALKVANQPITQGLTDLQRALVEQGYITQDLLSQLVSMGGIYGGAANDYANFAIYDFRGF